MASKPRRAFLPVGKLPQDLLARLLRRYARNSDRRVLLGPAVGEDACAIDMGRRLLVAKTDPITFVAEDIASYALDINANDVATRGADPKWFLATLLLPERNTTPAVVERLFRDLHRACRRLGVSLVGGHVEVTLGLDRPLVAGTLLGEVAKGKLIATRGARPGDDIVLTKGAAIEAVSILARERAPALRRSFPASFIRRCRRYSERLSILPEARIARRFGVHAMHDPTEGGLFTALHELAAASGCGLEARFEHIPVPAEARTLCDHFGLDPMGAIASGALLIVLPPRRTPGLLTAMRRARIPAAVIGRMLGRAAGALLLRGGRRGPLPRFERDEIARVFEAGS